SRTLSPRPGATSDAVEDCERRYGVTLPEDMRTLWLFTNGTEGASADDLTIWELCQFCPVPEVFTGLKTECIDLRCPSDLPNPYDYFVFADYLIHSFCYAINLR